MLQKQAEKHQENKQGTELQASKQQANPEIWDPK